MRGKEKFLFFFNKQIRFFQSYESEDINLLNSYDKFLIIKQDLYFVNINEWIYSSSSSFSSSSSLASSSSIDFLESGVDGPLEESWRELSLFAGVGSGSGSSLA